MHYRLPRSNDVKSTLKRMYALHALLPVVMTLSLQQSSKIVASYACKLYLWHMHSKGNLQNKIEPKLFIHCYRFEQNSFDIVSSVTFIVSVSVCVLSYSVYGFCLILGRPTYLTPCHCSLLYSKGKVH